jgi:hypothetical protein
MSSLEREGRIGDILNGDIHVDDRSWSAKHSR